MAHLLIDALRHEHGSLSPLGDGHGGLASTSLSVVVTAPAMPATLQFSSATYTADKSNRFAFVGVSRVGGSTGAVQVVCLTSNGTALAGQDYVSVATNLAWADGETGAKTVTVPLIDDDLPAESDRTVLLYLGDPAGGATLGAPSNAVLQITANTRINNGLIAHWTFDETNGAVAADSTGNGHNGTVANGAWTTGRVSGALQFNGTNSVVSVPDSAALSPVNALTVTLWARPAQITDGVLAAKWLDGSNESWLFRIRPDGTLRVNIVPSLNASSWPYGATAALMTVGAWHHVAMVYDGAQPANACKLQIYVDGIPQTLVFPAGNIPAALTVGTAPATFGLGPTGLRPFSGVLDDVRYYARALPARAIQALAAGSDDQDGDGLPDAWEILHFGATTNASAATDADGDGFPDADEYLAGTDPNTPGSFLGVVAISNTVSATATGMVVRWSSVAGKLYSVDRGMSLLANPAFPLHLRTHIPATPPMNTETDTTTTGQGPYFYRIGVQ